MHAVNSWHDFSDDSLVLWLCSLWIIYVGGRFAAAEGNAHVCVFKQVCLLVGASSILIRSVPLLNVSANINLFKHYPPCYLILH